MAGSLPADKRADRQTRRGSWTATWVWTLAIAAGMAGFGAPALAADPTQGRKIYQTHCENCHGANGAGQIPGAPDFIRGSALMKPDIELMRTVKSGRGMMPAYQGMFTETEILDVIAYLRTLRLQR